MSYKTPKKSISNDLSNTPARSKILSEKVLHLEIRARYLVEKLFTNV